jgi:hypothetical protein
MLKGHISYLITGAGVAFDPVTFTFPGSPGVSVTVSAPAVTNPDEASIHLRVEIAGPFTRDQAMVEAAAVAAAVCDRLTYQWGRYLPTPTLGDTAFDEDGVLNLGNTIGFFCRAAMVSVLGPQSTAELQDALARHDFPGDAHLATFRAALGCSDPIGQFLCLYGILMTVAGDDQKAIDTLIELHEPGQVRTPRPDKPHIQETVYTRLRNEVATPAEDPVHWGRPGRNGTTRPKPDRHRA